MSADPMRPRTIVAAKLQGSLGLHPFAAQHLASEVIAEYERTVSTAHLLELLAEREGEILSTEALPKDEAGC